MGDTKTWSKVNVVYPVGGGVFIHITNIVKTAAGYNQYIVVEPPRPPAKLLKVIEEVLALKIKPQHVAETAEESKKCYWSCWRK
ncbi:MAG: hypothetical protein QXE10_01160 [Desulfurococcaceae archaeon]